MNIYNNIPYTYLIGWSKLNKWYYGVRFSKKCHPTDLCKTYFTSSKHVHEYIKIYGIPDIIQIRKTFDDPKKARLWENKVLRRLNVIHDIKWINKSINLSICPEAALRGAKNKKPYKLNDPRYETCRKNGLKTGTKNLIQYQSNEKIIEVRKKSIETKKANYDKNRKVYVNAGIKSALTAKEKGTAKNFSNNNDAKKLYCERIKKGDHPNNKTKCPHCDKVGQYRAMKRWHFDNCKLK